MIGDLIAALALVGMQSAPPATESEAEPVINTGAGLLENCTLDSTADNEFHLGLCIGFIKGVTNAWTEQGSGQICPPDDLDNQDLRDTVVTWLRSHPQSRNASAVGSVLSAITEAFPCGSETRTESGQPNDTNWMA